VEGESGMNAKGEGCGVGIVTCADDDPCVDTLGIPVKPDEVEPVQGDNGALLPGGRRQNLIVRDSLVRPSRFVRGKNIISETSQFFDDASWKVLIGVGCRHHASRLRWMACAISSLWVSRYRQADSRSKTLSPG